LADPNKNGLVQLAEDATKCINLYYEYKVEKCLEQYEAKFGGGLFMGFNGNGPPGSEIYYSSYGNLTMSIEDKKSILQQEILKVNAQQLLYSQVQVPFFSTAKNLGVAKM
jgi:hypothetical protein